MFGTAEYVQKLYCLNSVLIIGNISGSPHQRLFLSKTLVSIQICGLSELFVLFCEQMCFKICAKPYKYFFALIKQHHVDWQKGYGAKPQSKIIVFV